MKKINNTEMGKNMKKSSKTMTMSLGMKKHLAIENCHKLTDKLCQVVLDGPIITLNERSQGKSHSVKKRLVRRIVEKRQAQTSRKVYGRTQDLLGSKSWQRSSNYCMYMIGRQCA